MKKLVVIATGWHFPLHFYRRMKEQIVPEGWEIEYVCVSHRDAQYAKNEKLDVGGKSFLHGIDEIMYKEIATEEDIQKLGWKYMLEPNTIGDWECANQWLENEKREYDVLLITHDDNFIVGNDLFLAVLEGEVECLYYNMWESKTVKKVPYDNDWLILSNAFIVGKPHLQGRFDFFKREIIDKMGGKFDLSHVTATRIGMFDTPTAHDGIANWNGTVLGMIGFLRDNDLFSRVRFLSETYRVSNYCIEGERGFIARRAVLGGDYEKSVKELSRRRKLI